MSEIFQIAKLKANGCPCGRYCECANAEGVCDYLAIKRTGIDSGAYCMANATNAERKEFLEPIQTDNGSILSIIKKCTL